MSGKSRLSLIALLMAPLIRAGSTSLEAERPQPWEWSVTVLDEQGVNLFASDAEGNPHEYEFTDSDSTFVRVDGRRRNHLRFSLWIENEHDPESLERIGFQGLDLELNPDLDPSGNGPCSYPDQGQTCPTAYPEDIPQCMADFLEGNRHPYTDQSDPNPDPDPDYMGVWLAIHVDCDIEGMGIEEHSEPAGEIKVQVHKSDDVLTTGCEDFHTPIVFREVSHGSGVIKITRLTPDSWMIRIDTLEDIDNDTIRFTEAYPGIREMVKGKKVHPNNVTMKPIRAIAPFKFTTIWTRSK
jgi:hypothetical protein